MSWLIAVMIAASAMEDEEMEEDSPQKPEQATIVENYKEAIINANSLREIELLIENMPPFYPHSEEAEAKYEEFFFKEKIQPIKNTNMASDVYFRTCSPEMKRIVGDIFTFLKKIEQMTIPEDIETLLKSVSEENIRSVVEPIALAKIEQLKSTPV